MKTYGDYTTRIFVISILIGAVVLVLASISTATSPPRGLERIAIALERIADCHCVSICDKRHCEGSSSSSDGGELP